MDTGSKLLIISLLFAYGFSFVATNHNVSNAKKFLIGMLLLFGISLGVFILEMLGIIGIAAYIIIACCGGLCSFAYLLIKADKKSWPAYLFLALGILVTIVYVVIALKG